MLQQAPTLKTEDNITYTPLIDAGLSSWLNPSQIALDVTRGQTQLLVSANAQYNLWAVDAPEIFQDFYIFG